MHRDALTAPVFKPLKSLTALTALAASPSSFDVTPNGVATWTMPVWAPAGRNGIEPSLSINYNSKWARKHPGSRLLDRRSLDHLEVLEVSCK